MAVGLDHVHVDERRLDDRDPGDHLDGLDDDLARACVIALFTARADDDPSLMSKGVCLRLVRTAEGTYEPETET